MTSTTAHTNLAAGVREALATAAEGTLQIPDLDWFDECGTDILFCDRGGRPTLLCAPDSAVAFAARDHRAALLSVLPRSGTCHLSEVILAGALRLLGTVLVEGRDVAVIGLIAESVLVEIHDPDAAAIAWQTLLSDCR